MIGGETKEGNYSAQELQSLINKASKLANNLNGSLLISTSRRTDPTISQKLIQSIKAPYFFYDWHKEKLEDNPYHGFLSLSDFFIVTGESVSTCCEALTTGKPVYIYRKEEVLYKKHIKFLDYLDKLGYTKYLNNQTTALKKWKYPPLKEAEKICQAIKEKLNVNANISV